MKSNKNAPLRNQGSSFYRKVKKQLAYFKDVDGSEYKVTLSVALDGTVESVYNVGRMKKTSASGDNHRIGPQRAADVSTNSISENSENVNSFSKKNAEINSQSIANLDGSTYSASLKGSENTLRYKPVAVGSEVSEAAKKALKNIELITNGKTDVVLTTDVISTADGKTANGAYVDGVLYVNANADSYARTMLVASHELTHALEDTKEYDALSAFIEESVKGDPALVEGYDIEKYRRAYENVRGEDFSEKTREYEARTEMYADFVANEILAKEDVVQRLVNRNRNVAVRLWTWLRSTLKRMSMNETERAEYDALRKAEKLLAAAIESSKGGISLEEVEQRNQAVSMLREKMIGEEMGEKETASRYALDKKKVKGYNKDKLIYRTFPNDKESGSEANRIAVWWVHNDDVITGDQTLISYHDKWYIIEKFDDMPSGYQIVDRITESEFNEIYKEIIEGGRSGKIKPLQSSPDFIDQLDKSGSIIKERASSSYRISAGYGRKNQSLQQVDTSTVEGREIDGIRNGDNARNSTNKQGRFSVDVEQSEKQKRDANYVTPLLKLSLTIKTCAKTLISALSGSSSLKYVNISASSSPEIIQNFSSLHATQFFAREFYPEYNSEYS